MLYAGFAGGLLGIACLGTRRGGFFGASIGAFSAVLGLARAVTRSNVRFRSFESFLEAFGTDLAGLDMRFRALHEESSDTSARVSWVSEDARAARKTVCCAEIGLLELKRQGQARESHFTLQVARVDKLITAMRADLLGVTFSHYQRSFRTLTSMVGRSEARLQETLVLRLCFGIWVKVLRTARLSELGSGELLRRCLCAWSAVASPQRASLSAVLSLQ